MSRLYSVPIDNVLVQALQDLFELTPATAKPCKVHGWSLAQHTDWQDTDERMVRVQTVRGVGATTGSGGSTVTPQPIDDDDTAAGDTTVEINNTTRMTAGGGSIEILETYAWNIRMSPWVHFYPPEIRPRVSPGNLWTLSLPEIVSGIQFEIDATLWFEEI